MSNQPKVIRNAPWSKLTYKINGLAMEIHNEIGPGHREWDYHRALAAKLKEAGLEFEFEPDLPVTLEDGTVVGSNYPDLVVEDTVIVEIKARTHSMTNEDKAQVIGYFAVLPQCPVALFLNFGLKRLEHRRLLPPKTVQAYQRQQWSQTTNKQPAAKPQPTPSAAPSVSPLPSAAPSTAPLRIDHIGIVVRDIQEALKVYETALGLPLQEIAAVPDQKVEVAFLPLGGSNLELVQPTSDDTGIAKFLEKRGEGIHHICIEVEDIEASLDRLRAHDVQLIDEEPRQGVHGRVAFVHPQAMHGVLIELIEYAP